MKFKFIGLVWDMTIPLSMIWVFIGMACCVYPFMLDVMPLWVTVLWLTVTFIYVSTARNIEKLLENKKENNNV